MKHIIPILLLMIFSLSLSCNNPKDESTKNQQHEEMVDLQADDLKATLMQINSVMDKAILDGDYETILNYYTDDVTLMPVFNPPIRGKDALRKEYEKDKKAGVKYHAFNAKQEKMWICGNEVFEYGEFGLAVSSEETEHPYAYYGSYFTIWEKQADNSYLMQYLITNLDHPPYNN